MMQRAGSSASQWAAFLSVCLIVHPLRAQSTNDVARASAMQHYERGVKLFNARDFSGAHEAFSLSEAFESSFYTQIQLVRCDEELGQLVIAWLGYSALLTKIDKIQSPAERKSLKDWVLQRSRALEPRLPKLTLRVSSAPAGLVVFRDDEVLPSRAIDHSFPVDPGAHVIRARAPGYEPFELRITLAEGQSTEVALVLAATTRGTASPNRSANAPTPQVHQPAAPKQTPLTPAPTASTSAQPTLGFALGGVGIAALLTAAAFAIQTIVLVNQSDAHCKYPDGSCDSTGFDKRRTASTAQTTGFVLLGAGAASLTLGLVLVFGAPKHNVTPEQATVRLLNLQERSW